MIRWPCPRPDRRADGQLVTPSEIHVYDLGRSRTAMAVCLTPTATTESSSRSILICGYLKLVSRGSTVLRRPARKAFLFAHVHSAPRESAHHRRGKPLGGNADHQAERQSGGLRVNPIKVKDL